MLLSFIILIQKKTSPMNKKTVFVHFTYMQIHEITFQFNLLHVGYKDRQSRNPYLYKWFQSFLLKIINLGNIKSYTKSKASKCKSTFVGHWHAWISLSFCSSWTSPGCLSNERWNSEQMTSESSQFCWMLLIALFCAMRTLSLDW